MSSASRAPGCPGPHRSAVLGSALLLLTLVAVACSSGDNGGGDIFTTPPVDYDAVRDLTAIAGSDTSVTLTWTSPTVALKAATIRYDLRYTPVDSVDTPWDEWRQAPAPTPDPEPGVSHTHEVTGLQTGAHYAFSLRAGSDGQTWSAPAVPAVAIVSSDFDQVPPAAVSDLQVWGATETTLTIAWSATGDDGLIGRATGYELRYAIEPITAGNWAQATPANGPFLPVAEAPDMWELTLIGLTSGTTYYCAVVAYDDEAQASGLSNVCSGAASDLRVLRVYVDGSGDYPTIEQAIGAADSGDLVLVGPGRYTWTNQGTGDPLLGLINVYRDHDGFEVRSMAGPEATIIDAEGQGGCWSVTGGTFSENGEIVDYSGITIDGFTLTGGAATGEPATPVRGWGGGGIYLHLSDSIIRNCIITGNEATEGGGVWIGGQGDAILEDCVITDNVSVYGGGVVLVNSEPHITVRRCTIQGNYSDFGGGLLAVHCTFTLEDCLIADNRGGQNGGGVAVTRIWPWDDDPNDDEVLQQARIIGCTIVGNTATSNGSGLYMSSDSQPRVERTVIAFNRTAKGLSGVAGSWPEIGCSLVYGNVGGDGLPYLTVDLGGNVFADPLFCAPNSYYPAGNSPCLSINRAGDECGLIGALPAGCSINR